MGNGFYMFGSKKINANIMANRLVVRVGGGHMGIDQFIDKHGHSEVIKLRRFTA
jgi:hypothetical protein